MNVPRDFDLSRKYGLRLVRVDTDGLYAVFKFGCCVGNVKRSRSGGWVFRSNHKDGPLGIGDTRIRAVDQALCLSDYAKAYSPNSK